MKVISDIRVYKSVIDNIEGNSLPGSLGNKPLNVVIHRIVMKLRERGFSLGDFDHLYINFTTCLRPGEMRPASRSVDRYHPWYRYYDIGVESALLEELHKETCIRPVVNMLEQVLLTFFAETEAEKEMIRDSIRTAVEQGPDMLMKFKEKKAAKCSAVIYLRFLDTVRYKPLLCVYDLDGNELLKEDLPECSIDLKSIGEIQLSSKKVTVKPRKNAFAKDLEPITFKW